MSDCYGIAITFMIARSALSQSSPAPAARRNAALGLDRVARPSKSGDRAACPHQDAPVITGRQTVSDRLSAGFSPQSQTAR